MHFFTQHLTTSDKVDMVYCRKAHTYQTENRQKRNAEYIDRNQQR